MSFTIDFLADGRVLQWEATADGAVETERDDYTPRFYVAPRDSDADRDPTTLQSVYDQHPDVVATEMVVRRQSRSASRFGSNTKRTTTGWRSCRSARATPAR